MSLNISILKPDLSIDEIENIMKLENVGLFNVPKIKISNESTFRYRLYKNGYNFKKRINFVDWYLKDIKLIKYNWFELECYIAPYWRKLHKERIQDILNILRLIPENFKLFEGTDSITRSAINKLLQEKLNDI